MTRQSPTDPATSANMATSATSTTSSAPLATTPASAPHPHSTTLRLVLGDQLNPLHPWFAAPQPDVVVVMMELRQETDYVRHHAQKVIAVLAAMRDFARHLKAQGHRVRYVALDDPSNRQSLTANLDALVDHYGATAVAWQQPDEWRLDEQLNAWAQARQQTPSQTQPGDTPTALTTDTSAPVHAGAPTLTCTAEDSAHFMLPRDGVAQLMGTRKQWLMEHHYRHLRRTTGVLMTADGQPEGGQWNFDHDNRKPWRGDPPEPPDARPRHDHSALWATIQAAGVNTVGEASAADFRWPLNRAESLALLQAFVAQALPHFGDFQDAMSTQRSRLFHSLLSFSLNTKMLSPLEVVQAAEAAYRSGQAPLAAAEGFIRQILGWREHVRGVYWAHMPGYTERNALGHDRPLPAWFWTGDTHMACVASALRHTLDNAHAHHIERLMVIGNFALLAGLHPHEVHRWYLGVYIDAFEWVEAPNTVGMSQWADGGLLATKPYVSSAAYIAKMGDACAGCAYTPKARTGTANGKPACPFNALYWAFFLRHQERLGKNPRLGLVFKQLERMPPEEKAALQAQADATLAGLEGL